MLSENGLFKMLEFDIAIFLFAIFQLCLTNLIVFKLVSHPPTYRTKLMLITRVSVFAELQVHGHRPDGVLHCDAGAAHPLQN